MKFNVSFVLLLLALFVKGQENQYWFQNFGAHSSALGGNVVASWSDNSAIFYNPGAHAFVHDPSISLASNTYTYYENYLNDGAGPGASLFHSSVEAVPSLIAGVLTSNEEEGLNISYGFMNIRAFNYNFNRQMAAYSQVLPSVDEEYYIGSYSYKNRIHEDWAGIGISKQYSETFGLGISLFGTITSMDYYMRREARLYINNESGELPIALNTYYNELECQHIGLLAKIGMAWVYRKINFGLVITTPRLGLPLVTSRIASSGTLNIPGVVEPASLSIYQEKIRSINRSPLIIDFGLRYKLQKTSISGRMAYHAQVGAYSLIDSSDVSPINGDLAAYGYYTIPGRAHKQTVNIGIAAERRIGSFDIMAGFRTDFNYLDREAIAEAGLDDISFSSWNLYHFNLGSTWVYQNKLGITISLGYAFGGNQDDLQRINLTQPDLDHYLYGPEGLSTRSNYYHFSATVGLTYIFLKSL